MNNEWNDYPISAFSAALGTVAGMTLGFLLALSVGIMIGFYGHNVSFSEANDGFFFMYLILGFPVDLLTHLTHPSGYLMTLSSIVLLILFFRWEDHKLEFLFLYTLSVGLYVFQSIGITNEQSTPGSWIKFCIACALIVGGYVVIRGIGLIVWKTQREK